MELFFKWIKQHLRIKAFYGNSPNAVRTQVWISISVYVLVAILKKELKLDRSLSEILQILSITLFEKNQLFTVLNALGELEEKTPSHKQLTLFDIKPDRSGIEYQISLVDNVVRHVQHQDNRVSFHREVLRLSQRIGLRRIEGERTRFKIRRKVLSS